MKAVALSARNRSLSDFQAALKTFKVAMREGASSSGGWKSAPNASMNSAQTAINASFHQDCRMTSHTRATHCYVLHYKYLFDNKWRMPSKKPPSLSITWDSAV